MLSNTIVAVAQGIPVGGFGLPAAVGVGGARHDGIVAAGFNFHKYSQWRQAYG